MEYEYNGEWYGISLKAADTIPIGAIIEYPSTTAPYGYLLCDGSAVSRTTYADLFAVIGTAHGTGDGLTTFNLPNRKGRIAVGYDSSDTDFDTIGETGGSKELQRHTHPVGIDGGTNSGSEINFTFGSDQRIYTPTSDGDIIGFAGTGNSGNLQPYQVSNFFIKYKQSIGVLANTKNETTTSDVDAYCCDYVNGKINELKPYVLYENSTGTTTSVPLSETTEHFAYIDVSFRKDNAYNTMRIPYPHNKSFTLTLWNMWSTDNVQQMFKKISIYGTNISEEYGAYMNYSTGGNNPNLTIENNTVYITKVVGYK